MAYIYKIVNDINQKIYIGKTEFSIKKRWKEHCNDYKREYCKNRPLYKAMNKYGIENFHIELIEETSNPEEKEIYWIEYYRSFKYGYNATKGGDGKKYIDYDLVIITYNKTKSIKETAKILNIDQGQISKILKINNYTHEEIWENYLKNKRKPVNQYDLNDNYIKTFDSVHEAVREILRVDKAPGGAVSHITDVCKGKRKTAYKYKWKFVNT